jgi:hypothetical protein
MGELIALANPLLHVLSWNDNRMSRTGLRRTIEAVVQVIDETLLAHVVDELARGVESAQALAPVFFDEVFKDLAEHLGVDGDFLFQRLGFVDREVVAVEDIEDAVPDIAGIGARLVGEERVWHVDLRLLPLVAGQRLKQTAVQKRYAAPESFAPSVVAAIRGERVVKQRFEHVVEQAFLFADSILRQPP